MLEDVSIPREGYPSMADALGDILADTVLNLLDGSVGTTVVLVVTNDGVTMLYQPPLFPEGMPTIGDALREDGSNPHDIGYRVNEAVRVWRHG